MNLLKLNDTTKTVPLYLVDSTTKAGKAGLTLAVTRSKNGSAFATAGGTAADLGNGFYSFTPAAGDVDTLGPLVFRATGSGADDFPARYTVVAFDPYAAAGLGLTNLDAAVSTRSTYAGSDTAGTTTLLGRLTAARAGYMDNLNVGGLVASASALGGLQVTVGGYAAGQDPATLVLDASASGHNTAGTVGAKLNAAGTAADPWATALPGSYSTGTAGNLLASRGTSNYSGGPVASVTAPVTVGTNNDKTGYALSAGGLDAIAITATSGPANTFPKMVVQLWRRFFKGSARAVSGATIKTFADDGTTVLTTQGFTDDGAGNETLGAAS